MKLALDQIFDQKQDQFFLITAGGGSGLLSDAWTIEPPKDVGWPRNGAAGLFIDIYDWDTVYLQIDVANTLSQRIELCTRFFPCNMVLKGSGTSSSLERSGNGSIACLASSGCSTLSIISAQILCTPTSSQYSIIDVESASLQVHSVTIAGCFSESDGGGVRCYGAGGTVQIGASRFLTLKSSGMGGAISAIGCAVFISNSIFRACSAMKGGGAISGSLFQCYGSVQNVETRLEISQSLFDRCWSTSQGGAILITSSAASAIINQSAFTKCNSNSSGGALAASDAATVRFVDSVMHQNVASESGGGIVLTQLSRVEVSGSNFTSNSAQSGVGGAVYASEANLILTDSKARGNRAPSNAGGAMFWEGSIDPVIIESGEKINDLHAAFCDFGNSAIYGDCLASSYASLEISLVPDKIFAGLPFLVVVKKRDAYNQTILTDSDSVLQTGTAIDKTYRTDTYVGISGNYITSFDTGQASFSIIVKPSFTLIDSARGLTALKTYPAIYFKGLDAQNGKMMQSSIVSITMQSDSTVCPPGFVLILDETRPGSNQTARQGTCTLCGAGTYSVNPLAGATTSTPACFNCPTTATCTGGYHVAFKLGSWIISGGMFRLIGCPLGHELVNSIGGVFSHDVQGCIACPSNAYILNPNNSNFSCQNCPVGAVCDGNSLASRVIGAVWLGDTSAGLYYLASCPPGYEMQSATLDGQQCLLCPATYYCVGGSVLRGSCPDGTYCPPGTNSSSYCLPVVYVAVVLTLPLAQEEFTTDKQASLQQALASAAGVGAGYVTLAATSAIRRSSATSIQVRIGAAS